MKSYAVHTGRVFPTKPPHSPSKSPAIESDYKSKPFKNSTEYRFTFAVPKKTSTEIKFCCSKYNEHPLSNLTTYRSVLMNYYLEKIVISFLTYKDLTRAQCMSKL